MAPTHVTGHVTAHVTADAGAAPQCKAPAAPPRGARGARGESDAAPRCITSAHLFEGAAEVQIEHHGAVYRLKQTALGKLILTK